MRTIIITGASRGIGKCIAEKALEIGHNLSLGIRNIDSLKGSNLDPKIINRDNLIINKYDSTKINSAENLVEETNKYYGGFDTLIHCAGIFRKTKLNYIKNEDKDIDDLWKTNVLGPWVLTRAAWKFLSINKSGRIIVLVSMSGKRSKSNLAGYTVSKFALMGLCQTIRNEGWDKGIRVTAICPGWVNTDMSQSIKQVKKKDMTQPEDIAEIISKLLELPNSCIPFEISVNCNLET